MWVAWVGSWDLATRTTDNLAKVFDFVVCEQPDLVERIEALLVNDDLRRGYGEADTVEHRTHGIHSRHCRVFGLVGVSGEVQVFGVLRRPLTLYKYRFKRFSVLCLYISTSCIVVKRILRRRYTIGNALSVSK